MNRTINERKAFRWIVLSLLGNYLSMFMLLIGSRESWFILFTIGIIVYMATLMFLLWGAYSLGWEYKTCFIRDSKQGSKKKC